MIDAALRGFLGGIGSGIGLPLGVFVALALYTWYVERNRPRL